MATRFGNAELSQDTSPDIEEVLVRRWREMSPSKKARLIIGLCQTAEALSLAGIRRRYPGASPHECFLRLSILKLGRDLAQRAYPEMSELRD